MTAQDERGVRTDLISATVFCFVVALMLMVFSVWFYLCYWDKMQLDLRDSDGSSEDDLGLIRDLAFGLPPLLAFAFSLVGYIVWKCYDRYTRPSSPPE